MGQHSGNIENILQVKYAKVFEEYKKNSMTIQSIAAVAVKDSSQKLVLHNSPLAQKNSPLTNGLHLKPI